MMQGLLRFTLDLFQPGPDAAQAQRPKTKPQPQPQPQPTVAAALRHPRASREAVLHGTLVGYEIKRRKRRTIGFSVGAEGLAVSAPKWVPLYEIDRAVQCKSGWILKKLDETRERGARLEAARIDWRDGAVFPFLGQPVRLRLDPLAAHGQLDRPCLEAAGAVGGTLHIALAVSATHDQIRDAVKHWLRAQATPLFTERLDHFAPLLGVRWRKLSLSSAVTRWGSASASGAIRLNGRLVHLSLPLIDYVAVHELSHLRVMDHSPRFWATVAEVLPAYADLRRQLKDEAVCRW